MNELEQLSELFIQHGATQVQAKRMASQLLKRAEQNAESEGISKIEALSKLLEITMRGLNGIGPDQS